jgi:hypothetical protein
VAFAGYHYPTIRGQNQEMMFSRQELAAVTRLLDEMLDGVAAGSFVPTDEPRDCRYCDFGAVCRVRRSSYGNVDSALAEWSREHLNAGVWPAFANLQRTRRFED